MWVRFLDRINNIKFQGDLEEHQDISFLLWRERMSILVYMINIVVFRWDRIDQQWNINVRRQWFRHEWKQTQENGGRSIEKGEPDL